MGGGISEKYTPGFEKARLKNMGVYLLPMTRNRHAALMKAIQLKKAGRAWDAESLKEIR